MTRFLLALLAALAAAHNRRLLAEAAAGCPDKVPAPEPTPIHDALAAEWRRNANDYARAVTDLEYVQTVDDLAVVGGWE